jgi:hypothetical protein
MRKNFTRGNAILGKRDSRKCEKRNYIFGEVCFWENYGHMVRWDMCTRKWSAGKKFAGKWSYKEIHLIPGIMWNRKCNSRKCDTRIYIFEETWFGEFVFWRKMSSRGNVFLGKCVFGEMFCGGIHIRGVVRFPIKKRLNVQSQFILKLSLLIGKWIFRL